MIESYISDTLARSHCAEFEDDLRHAMDLVSQVLEIDPLNRDALLIRARLWAQMGRMHSAVAELKALLSLDADNADARLTLANILMLMSRSDEAAQHLHLLSRSMKLDSDFISRPQGQDVLHPVRRGPIAFKRVLGRRIR